MVTSASERTTDRQERITREGKTWNQQGIHDARVLVVGAGNIGVRLGVALAEAGFRFIDFLDKDTISLPNLSRGAGIYQPQDLGKFKAEVLSRRLKRVNRRIQARGLVGDVRFDFGVTRFGDYDIILLATHDLSSRRHVNRFTHLFAGRTKAIIDGGISVLSFSVQTILPFISPCYSCTLPPDVHDPDAYQGCNGVVVGIDAAPAATNGMDGMAAAALMVKEAALIMAGLEPFFAGREYRFDGDAGAGSTIILENVWGRHCTEHILAEPGDLLAVPLSPDTLVAALRWAVAERCGVAPDDIYLTPLQLTTSHAICMACRAQIPVMRPQQEPRSLRCHACDNADPDGFELEFVRDLVATESRSTLADYGIPERHALHCYIGARHYYLVAE